jgi:hypothetical protein
VNRTCPACRKKTGYDDNDCWVHLEEPSLDEIVIVACVLAYQSSPCLHAACVHVFACTHSQAHALMRIVAIAFGNGQHTFALIGGLLAMMDRWRVFTRSSASSEMLR